MDIENLLLDGEAVKHNPLPPLTPLIDQVGFNEANDTSNSSRHLVVPALGGFIGNGQLAWRAIGPTLEIFDPLMCTRQAAWTFGTIFHNSSAKVTCVCGIGSGTITHVAIGIDLGKEKKLQGLVGILSLQRSRIVRAFHFQYKVTNICMITGGEKVVDPSTLKSELRHCQGLISVATAHAFLYLIDIALDMGADEITSDEVSPASYASLSVPDPNPESSRSRAVRNKSHPLLCLSESMSSGGQFRLLGADDTVLYETASHSVTITSMTFVPQLASLIIGYNFGSFQIINLSLITIDCTSPYEENFAPVFSVIYQEPEHDPRSFVYLWVCRSFCLIDSMKTKSDSRDRDKSTSSTLYALNYEKKEWIEGHGLWYQILLSISPRFDFDLLSLLGRESDGLPCKMLTALTVVGATPSNAASPLNCIGPAATVALTSADEESGPVPELSLSMFFWEAHFLDQGRISSKHYLVIFDINQWYQAQMPPRFCVDEDSLSPYMSFHILDKVPKTLGENLLSTIPRLGSWSRHTSKSKCENDWFPSSLSYDLFLLTSQSLVTYHCSSVQQRAISTFIEHGPKSIVYPHSHHTAYIVAGILPPDSSIPGCTSVGQERENLLSVSLEYDLLPLLIQCVNEFSEGLFSHLGCSLELLLQWAWNKVHHYKSSYDVLCVSLFNSEPETLCAESLVVLHQNLSYLSHLCTIISAIRDAATDVTQYSKRSLDSRVQVVKLFHMHLQAILWFYHCGLLPQYITDEPLDESSVPYPATVLQNSYNTRYSEIKKLSSSLKGTDLLLIDSLVEEASNELEEIWEKDDKTLLGIYPPPSLQSLLTMYLLPGLSVTTKHRIVQYLFLDLAALLNDSYSSVVEELVKFPSSFSLSPSFIKITQAFWLIDHGFFQEGLDVLMHPLVNPDDISSSQQRRLTKAFLFQGEEKLAIAYNQIRQPPSEELEDVRLNLTVLLANGRIREAFHYQRLHRVRLNAKDLMNHFFVGCEQVGNLEAVVHLPLSIMEEEAFVAYLQKSSHVIAQDILLSYYIQQSRYSEIDIFRGKTSGQRQCARSALVTGYLSHLPAYQNKKKNLSPKPVTKFYHKPKPFSASIRQSSFTSTPRTKSTNQRLNAFHFTSGPKESRPAQLATFTPFRSRVQRREAIGTWNKEMGINDESLIYDEINRDASLIVFPTMLGGTEAQKSRTPQEVNSLLPKTSQQLIPINAQSAFSSPENDSMKQNVSRLMEGVLRTVVNNAAESTPRLHGKRFSHISSDVICLLKTPPVHKSSITKQKEIEIFSETPHSILKVRKILQRSISPVEFNDLNSPSSLPSRRSIKKIASFSTTQEEAAKAADPLAATPKQLRFHLPSGSAAAQTELPSANLLGQFDEVSSDGPPNAGLQEDSKNLSNELASESPSPRKPLPGYVERELVNSMNEEFVNDEDTNESVEKITEFRETISMAPNSHIEKVNSSSTAPSFFRDKSLEDSFTLNDPKDCSVSSQETLNDSFHSLNSDTQSAQLADELMDVGSSPHKVCNSPKKDEIQQSSSLAVENVSSTSMDVPDKSSISDVCLVEIPDRAAINNEKDITSSSDYPTEMEVEENSSRVEEFVPETCQSSINSENDSAAIASKGSNIINDAIERKDSLKMAESIAHQTLDQRDLTYCNAYEELDSTCDVVSKPNYKKNLISEFLERNEFHTDRTDLSSTSASYIVTFSDSEEEEEICGTDIKNLQNSDMDMKRSSDVSAISILEGQTSRLAEDGSEEKANVSSSHVYQKDSEIASKLDTVEGILANGSSEIVSLGHESALPKIEETRSHFEEKIAPVAAQKSECVEQNSFTKESISDSQKDEGRSELDMDNKLLDYNLKINPDSANLEVIPEPSKLKMSPKDASEKLEDKDDIIDDVFQLQQDELESQLVLQFSDSDEETKLELPIVPFDKKENLCTNSDEDIKADVNGEALNKADTNSQSVDLKENRGICEGSSIPYNNNNDSYENKCHELKKISELTKIEVTENDQYAHLKTALAQLPTPQTPLTPKRRARRLSGLVDGDNASLPGSGRVTPIRRSRRLSGISFDGDEANVPSSPSTPARRSRRLSGGISNNGDELNDVTSGRATPTRNRRLSGSHSGDVENNGRLTPVRRSRRLSGLSHSENEDIESTTIQTPTRSKKLPGTTISTSKNSTPSKRGNKSTASLVVEASSDFNMPDEGSAASDDKENESTVKPDVIQQGISTPLKVTAVNSPQVPPSPTLRASPGRNRRHLTPETPIRRSARLNCTQDALGTIIEEKNVESDNSSAEQNSQILATKSKLNATQTTPNKSRRKSSNQSIIIDPNLETIEESAELSSKCLKPPALSSSAKTNKKKEEKFNGSLSHDESEISTSSRRQTRGSLTRTRRDNSSSCQDDTEKVSIGNGTEMPENGSNHNDSDELSLSLLTPAPSKARVPLGSKSTLLVPNSTAAQPNKQTTQHRKSLHSLTIGKDYDISDTSIDNIKYTRRKSCFNNENPSSVVVIRKRRTVHVETPDLQTPNELEFDLNEGDISSPKGEEKPDPSPYNLIEISPLTPIAVSLLKSKKRKASYRRVPTSLSIPKDYSGFSDEDEILQPSKKKQRKKSSRAKSNAGKAAKNSQSDFPFSNPDVIEEDPSCANGTEDSAAATTPSTAYIFSPPNVEKSGTVKIKRKAKAKKER